MADYGARMADRSIATVHRKLRITYARARKELEEKLAAFVRKFEAKDREKRAEVEAGVISEAEYKKWLGGQVFMKQQIINHAKQMNEILKHSNEEAIRVIHDKRLDVFAENYNWEAFKTEGQTGISFDIYNTQAVAKLIARNPQILPKWNVDEEKDYQWNYKKVKNTIRQGIIQGKSIPDIAKMLCRHLATQNENRMRMFARTGITEAQNAGRIQEMEDAQGMGIEIRKQWIATLDNRTRDAHRHLDGEEADVDKPFKSDLGDIMYPGDPAANPANVYNCRCTLISVYPKYRDIVKPGARRAYGEYEDQEGKTHRFSYLTTDPEAYEKWKRIKRKEKAVESASSLFEDTVDWLKSGTIPGIGEVKEPERHNSRDYPHELLIAKTIRNVFGGDIEILDQTGNETVADYLWKNELWELKHPSSLTAVDDRTHGATKKMQKINCNIMLDINVEDIEKAMDIVRRRIIRSSPRNCHLVIFHKSVFYGAWKYNKNR